LIPAGLLITVPVAEPLTLTTRPKLGDVFNAKTAVTVVLAVRATAQEPVPLQPPPLQPANRESPAGVAVSVTEVPLANAAEHVVPQLMPLGLLVTEPEPVLALTTASVNCCEIVNVTAFDVPPPGAGLSTMTCAFPATATSDAEITVCNCVLFT